MYFIIYLFDFLKNGTSGLWNAGVLQFAIHKPAHHTQIKINSLCYCENIICRQLKAGIFLFVNKKERNGQEKTCDLKDLKPACR